MIGAPGATDWAVSKSLVGRLFAFDVTGFFSLFTNQNNNNNKNKNNRPLDIQNGVLLFSSLKFCVTIGQKSLQEKLACIGQLLDLIDLISLDGGHHWAIRMSMSQTKNRLLNALRFLQQRPLPIKASFIGFKVEKLSYSLWTL
jgi:hypothetical protein